MKPSPSQYAFDFDGSGVCKPLPVLNGRDFRLREDALVEQLAVSIPRRARDLLRVGMALYVADRISRRAPHGRVRRVALDIPVSEPQFWESPQVTSRIEEAVWLLGKDSLSLRFRPSTCGDLGALFQWSTPTIACMTEEGSRPGMASKAELRKWGLAPTVCLYSGGLDSAAGLATQLRSRKTPTIAVTAWHQGGLRGAVRKQLAVLKNHYAADLYPLIVKTHLLAVPWRAQDRSQRWRSFLFMALGGTVASATGASTVEVFESGVGALNLPLMAGMQVGARNTRGCHPRFLRLISELTSRVAERDITFSLPFREWTKAEVVRTLAADSLVELAKATFSCVHYPQRVPGVTKQCGCCAGCIGRRQALFTAGIEESPGAYTYDLFNKGANGVSKKNLGFLKATIMQLGVLEELRGTELPDSVKAHVYGTRVIEPGESVKPWVEVLLRYREEWLKIIERGMRQGWRWAHWLGTSSAA